MTPKLVLLILTLFLGAALCLAGFIAYKKSTISQVNALKKDARKAYLTQEFETAYEDLKLLLDSMEQKGDAERLNFAHSGFHLMKFDSSTTQDSAAIKRQLEYAESANLYRDVSAQAKNKELASIAYNQLGVTKFKLAKPKELEDEERALDESAAYFRSALEKDYENDIARYNYELARRRIALPEIILAKVKELVRHRRYKDARDLLKETLQKSPRTQQKFGEIINRIQTIITIDSVSRS